jgi:chorismate mutase
MKLLAVRGAITCDENTKEEITERTQRLVTEMMARNDIAHDDLVSLVFTCTEDLNAAFPAAGARAIGLGDVPLMCAREMSVPGALPMVVRILMHTYTDHARNELHHVYLEGARSLRDDLPE